MEICRMDSSSHFSSGMNPPQSVDENFDFNEITEELSTTFFAGKTPAQSVESVNSQQYQNLGNQNEWKSDFECKEENQMEFVQNDSSSYGSENEFNEPYQFEYNQCSPLYTNEAKIVSTTVNSISKSRNLHRHQMGPPFQLTYTKNQLPSWYTPPSNCFPPQPLHQQQYPYQQGIPMGSQAPSAEHSMRNMIHLTSRNGREARNRAEKHRRDKLNGSIQELSSMVPHVAESPRRVDKTAVLRFSAHGLRIDYVFGNQDSNRYLINPKSTEGLMKLLDTFLLTITCRANIVLISSSVEQYLGHCRSDLYGQSLLNITHPDDHAFLKQQLIPTDLHNLFAAKTDESGEIRSRTQEEEEEIDKKLREDRRDFNIRLARAGPRSEPTIYEVVRIDGCFKRAEAAPRGKPTAGPTGLQLIRRARGRDDNIPLHSISGNDIVLIAMARIVKPSLICDRLIEACRYEYKTRHLIDGRIVQCDQRISIVAGYMTEEISGVSPFTFIHRDDVRWVMVALRQMYDFGKAYGESCYRLMSRAGQFIYLKTRGCLEIDDKTREVRSFVCMNSLVSDEEGRRLIREMKKKFSAIISEAELSAMESDVPAVENPQNLERAILNLITNLNNAATYDDDNVSLISDSTNEMEDTKRTKSPPLAIIAPKLNTIKTSLTRAAGVIGVSSKGKSPTIKDEPESPGTPHQAATSDLCRELNIKVEPANSMLSPPSSSMSSLESDVLSPYMSNPTATNTLIGASKDNAYTSGNQWISENLPNISSGGYFTPCHDLPDIATASTNDTVLMASNNNDSNINRNSVLKRSYNSGEDDFSEMIKRRTLSANCPDEAMPNPSMDLLSSSGDDISEVLSSAFPDDSLANEFRYDSTTAQLLPDEAEQEQREILNSLRESCTVIQSTSKLKSTSRETYYSDDGR